ncbi:MAG: hypothetical protein ACI9P7_002353, partial [Candidatus Azotimanducaceae bacterium]
MFLDVYKRGFFWAADTIESKLPWPKAVLKMHGVLAVTLLFIGSVAFAAPDPQSIEVGGGKLIPTLSIVNKHDDNIFSQATSEESDTITQLKPSVQWLQEKDTTQLAVTYSGDYGLYWDSNDDDYDDHNLSFDAGFSPSDIARF